MGRQFRMGDGHPLAKASRTGDVFAVGDFVLLRAARVGMMYDRHYWGV